MCVCVLSVNSTDPDEYNIILNISKIGVCVCVRVYKRNQGDGEEENEKKKLKGRMCVCEREEGMKTTIPVQSGTFCTCGGFEKNPFVCVVFCRFLSAA